MRRDVFIGAIVILLIIAGVLGYAVTRPLPAQQAPTIPVDALSSATYEEHAAYYTVAANYASSTPLLSLVGPAADTSAVALMKKFVDDTISQFKTDGNFSNLTAHDIAVMGLDQGKKEDLQIMYLFSSSMHTISYIYTVTEDTLGAHPNTYFKTFTFDTTTGAPLALADVFTPGSDYLATLSQISRAELPGVIGDGVDADFVQNFIDPGTTPEDKNFANFFFDDQDFVILFAPYAVAPYSAGPQTLRIPLTELASILKPAYQ